MFRSTLFARAASMTTGTGFGAIMATKVATPGRTCLTSAQRRLFAVHKRASTAAAKFLPLLLTSVLLAGCSTGQQSIASGEDIEAAVRHAEAELARAEANNVRR